MISHKIGKYPEVHSYYSSTPWTPPVASPVTEEDLKEVNQGLQVGDILCYRGCYPTQGVYTLNVILEVYTSTLNMNRDYQGHPENVRICSLSGFPNMRGHRRIVASKNYVKLTPDEKARVLKANDLLQDYLARTIAEYQADLKAAS